MGPPVTSATGTGLAAASKRKGPARDLEVAKSSFDLRDGDASKKAHGGGGGGNAGESGSHAPPARANRRATPHPAAAQVP
jgi:hypothetical protein